ncbi:MAG: DUF6745 domain-containing protein [Acidobacteriota bacterium]
MLKWLLGRLVGSGATGEDGAQPAPDVAPERDGEPPPPRTSVPNPVLFKSADSASPRDPQGEDPRPEPTRLVHRKLRRLPPDLDLSEGLVIEKVSRLRALPDGLVVRGSLRIFQCPQLETLGRNLQIEGDLEITNCPQLKSLGPGLEVKGSLKISGCVRFQDLGSTTFGGSLRLLGRMALTRLPDDLRFRGHVVIQRVGIEELPERMNVGGALVLKSCGPLRRLPLWLRTGSDCSVSRCPNLETLPEHVEVGGALAILGCPKVKVLPLPVEARDVRLEGCTGLLELPGGWRVPGRLSLTRCTRLKELPPGLWVGPDDGVDRWSEDGPRWDWRAREERPGALDLRGCHALLAIPDDLKADWVEMGDTSIRSAPESLRLAWNRVEVPHKVALRPEELTFSDVVETRNAEVRRVIFERLDVAQVLEAGAPDVIDRDEDPGGARRLLRVEVEATPVVFLECRCPSTGRVYHLRVPPQTRSCRHAAAWIAGFDNPDDYAPLVET